MANGKPVRCYSYIRVSTQIQVEGYSIDAQRETIKDYAIRNNMIIVHEYVDAGKSGKNTTGRPAFLQMLEDIKQNKDGVSYVVVFKLSRFGRNTADIMNSVQLLEDYGINLVCIEDYLDTGKGFGSKLLISILSSVAELERENIRVQTLAGRQQKAKEGRWNGGFAPYGYKLENGELKIAEDEADVIRFIYKEYTETNISINKLVLYLNEHYQKKIRQNGSLGMFSVRLVQMILDNPVYCGKLAYGRRKTEKINGTRNEYHIVKQAEFPVYDGVHEAIVSEEVWEEAQKKRAITKNSTEKKYSINHAHILSGLIHCPVCGAMLYGNVARKKKKDGSGMYKDYWYYSCKHRLKLAGHSCTYRKQWLEEKVNHAVEEIVLKLVHDDSFVDMVEKKIGQSIDTTTIEAEKAELEKKARRLAMSKDRVAFDLDNLDPLDKLYEMRYSDLQHRLNGFYEAIGAVEDDLAVLSGKLLRIKEDQNQRESIYKLLLYFDKFYAKFTEFEKKEFMQTFVESIEIYPEEQEDGRFLRSISFNFPIIFNGEETSCISLDTPKTVETVVLLSKLCDRDNRVQITLDENDLALTSAETKATYEEIKDYILKEYGVHVSNLYISQVRNKYGLPTGKNYNLKKSNKYHVPNCSPEKEKLILDALRHFQMIA